MNFIKERDKKAVRSQNFEGVKNPFEHQKTMSRQPSNMLNQICFSGGVFQK